MPNDNAPRIKQLLRQTAEEDEAFVAHLSQWLEQRVALSRELLELEAKDPARGEAWVAELLHRVQAKDAGVSPWHGVPSDCIRGVLQELRCGLAATQHRPRVVYLGPAFSYSHLAALTRFGEAAELLPVGSIAGVFEEIERGHVDYGIAPLENSTDGRVADTLTCFARTPVRVCGEVRVPIHHNLLSNSDRSEIRLVCSKPQALSQCREWLARHMPDVQQEPTASTTAAAARAAEEPGCAAIASRQAAAQYNVTMLAEHIEDNPNNVTRFAVIGSEPSAPTGNDKCSLMFELPHQPGALADAMQLFKQHQLNMTWIESFPLPGKEAEYLFFVEVEGHQDTGASPALIAELQRLAVRLEVLGSYPQDTSHVA